MNRTALFTLTALSASLWLPSCTSSPSEPSPASNTDELPSYNCGPSIEGEVTPTTPIEGVASLRYKLSTNGTIELRLLDAAGAEVGRVQALLEPFLDGSRLGASLRVTYEEAGEQRAAQHTDMQWLGGRIVARTRHEVGDQHALLWSEISRQGELTSLTLGAPTRTPGNEPVIIDGDQSYLSKRVVHDGDAPDAAGARQFMAAQGLDTSINRAPAFMRLVAAMEDSAWREAAELQLRRCDASAAAAMESTLQSLSVCPHEALQAAGTVSQVQQAAGCDENKDPLRTVLKIESMLGAVGSGLVLATALVAASPALFAGSTLALAGTLVGSIIVVYVTGNAIGSLINNNSDKIPGLNQLQNIGTDAHATGGRQAGTRGDPHLLTLDGLYYDLHAAGEFTLVGSGLGRPLSMQIRQEPTPGNCPNVAINTAYAASLGDTTVHLDRDRSRPLRIGGRVAIVPGDVLLFQNGDSLERLSPTHWRLTWSSGDQAVVSGVGGGSHVNVSVALPSHRRGKVHGLLGDFNGDRSDDLRGRDDRQVFTQPVSHEELLAFAAEHRISQQSSLFAYDEGRSTNDYDVAGFPEGPVSLDDLPQSARDDAQEVCAQAGVENPISLRACILDVACTGDDGFASSHVGVHPDAELAVGVPLDYAGWVAEGDGNWVIADDGRSVVQTRNGDPTFFVSPDDYLNVTFTGSLTVETTNDDDIIGFALGYQAPLSANGDDPLDLRSVLLSWKQRNQTYNGRFAEEGLTLVRSTGVHTESHVLSLWGLEDSPVLQRLGTHYGTGRGWIANTTHRFSLTYTESLVEIVLDGAPLFRVTAAQAGGPFEPGRFGFYNYSQNAVRYADFSVTPLP